MIDQEYETTKERIIALIDTWKERLWLNSWYINLVFERIGIPSSSPNHGAIAFAEVRWEYLSAHLTFDMPLFFDLPPHRQERCIIHELCHVIVAEMRDCMRCDCGLDQFDIKHEERVCTMLDSAIFCLVPKEILDDKETPMP